MIKQRLLHGAPIRAGEREIIAEARLTWIARRRATFGAQASQAYGGMVVHLQPIAVIERGPERTRRIPVYDQTRQLLGGLLAGALAVPFLMELAVRLARPKREGKT